MVKGERGVARGRVRGYSLIEMAVSLVVIGVLAGPAMAIYSVYKYSQQRQTTLGNIQYVVDAIQNYRLTSGNYPCPGPLNVSSANANYGRDLCAAGIVTTAAPAANSCANGVCIETSARTRVPALITTEQRVVVGAVPFRELQIDESRTYDGYGSRIVYAVTQSETDINTIDDLKGAVSVQSATTGPSLIDPPDSAIFVVFSAGPSKVGGWNRNGMIADKCTGAVGLDVGNCNPGFEGGAAAVTPLFIYAYENTAPGSGFYDDQMTYFSSHTDPLWARSPTNPNDIHSLTTNSVGIGTTAPAAGTALDITATGGAQALLAYGTTGSDGNILADQICDENGLNCFDPKVIGGSNASGEGMLCPSGANKFMVGISNGGPKCDYIRTGCGTGANYVLYGVDALGNPVCGLPPNPSCAAMTASICAANDVALPAAADRTVTSTYGPLQASAGGCRYVAYKCNAGTWNKTTDTNPSRCSFTPVCTTTIGLPCPQGYSGTYSSTNCTQCSGAPVVTTTQSTACICTGGTFTASAPCSAPWTGTKTQTITYFLPGCTVTSSPWTGCVCGLPATDTQTQLCNTFAGYNTGYASRTRTLNISSCSYGSWSAWNLSQCSCSIAGQTRTVAGSCPAGYTGGKQDQTVVNCAWTNTGAVYGCTCDTTGWPRIAYVAHDCASSTPVTYPNGYDCYYPDPAASAGHEDQWTTTLNASSCTPNPSTVTQWGICLAKSFTWQQTGVNGNSGSPNGLYEGDACSCQDHLNTLSAAKVCYIHGDVNNTMYLCRCQ